MGTTSSELSDVTFTNTRRQGSLALSVEVKSPIATDRDKGFPVEVRATGDEANHLLARMATWNSIRALRG